MIKKIFTILIGLVFAGIGVYMLKQGNEVAERCTQETVGTVVELVEESDISDTTIDYSYYPVVQYNVGDQQFTKKYTTGSGTPAYYVDQQIDIKYDPNKPEDYIIVGDKSSNVLGIIFTAMGIFVAICGVVQKNFD